MGPGSLPLSDSATTSCQFFSGYQARLNGSGPAEPTSDDCCKTFSDSANKAPQYAGQHHAGFEADNPSQANYRPPLLSITASLQGLQKRRGLLQQFDRFRARVDQHGDLLSTDRFRELAFQMLTSPDAARAFDVTANPNQSCTVLARGIRLS